MGGASSIPLIGGFFNTPLDDFNPPATAGQIPYAQGYQNVFQNGAAGAGSVPAPQLGFGQGFAPSYGGAPYAAGIPGAAPPTAGMTPAHGTAPGMAPGISPGAFGPAYQQDSGFSQMIQNGMNFARTGQNSTPGMQAPGGAFRSPSSPATAGLNPLHPNNTTPAPPPTDPFQTGQTQLMGQLQAQAAGQGPSIAQNQLQQATDQNIAQAYAMGASLQGNNPGGVARGIAYQRAGIQQTSANQSAQLRAQEQLSAQSQLASLLNNGRTQDIGVASTNAQLTMQQQQLNNQMVQFYLGSGMSLAEAQQAAAMSYQQLLLQKASAQTGANSQAMQTNSSMIGAGMGAGATMFGGGGAAAGAGGGASSAAALGMMAI